MTHSPNRSGKQDRGTNTEAIDKYSNFHSAFSLSIVRAKDHIMTQAPKTNPQLTRIAASNKNSTTASKWPEVDDLSFRITQAQSQAKINIVTAKCKDLPKSTHGGSFPRRNCCDAKERLEVRIIKSDREMSHKCRSSGFIKGLTPSWHRFLAIFGCCFSRLN